MDKKNALAGLYRGKLPVLSDEEVQILEKMLADKTKMSDKPANKRIVKAAKDKK